MGWISKRHMERGGSIGTGPKGGRHKGPLRKIVATLTYRRNLFAADAVRFECGHEGESWGGVRARCADCGTLEPEKYRGRS